MRLVTFVNEEGLELAGALFDQDQAVLDLQKAYTVLKGGQSAALSSVLALAEAGEEGLSLARALLAKAPVEAVRQRAAVHLRAPIQPPPQMRDCSASSCICARGLLPHADCALCALLTRRRHSRRWIPARMIGLLIPSIANLSITSATGLPW